MTNEVGTRQSCKSSSLLAIWRKARKGCAAVSFSAVNFQQLGTPQGAFQNLGPVSAGSLHVKLAVLAQKNTNSISWCFALNTHQVGGNS
jgi:hypothetical protein